MPEFPKFLKVASVQKPGIAEIDNESNLKGYEAKWLSLLSETLKFQFQLVTPPDNLWGTMDQNGNWSGIIGVLQRNEADMAVSYLTITDQRRKVVDFSEPYSYPKLIIATDPPQPRPKSLVYLYPFDAPTWVGIFVVLLILPVLMRLFNKKKLSYSSRFMTVLGHLLNQELRSVQRGWFIGTWLMVAFVLSRSYSCLVYSYLTVPLYESPLRSLQELTEAVKSGKYEVFNLKGTSFSHLLREGGYPYLADMSQDFGLDMSVNGVMGETPSGKKHALVTYNTAFYLSGWDLWLRDAFWDGSLDLHSTIAIALNKKFCCKPALDRAIVRLKQAGLYQRILDRHSAMNVIKVGVNASFVQERVLTVEDVSGALFIWLCGISISVLCLVLEIGIEWAKRKFVK